MLQWDWTDDGVILREGENEAAYLFRKIDAQDLENYLGRFWEETEIGFLLKKARDGFMEGRGHYSDAYTQARGLHQGVEHSRGKAMQIAHEIQRFFEPPEITLLFGESWDLLSRFAGECAQRLPGVLQSQMAPPPPPSEPQPQPEPPKQEGPKEIEIPPLT